MNPIKMTEQAAAQIGALLDKAPEGSPGVRLSIKSTGCSGHSYHMEYVKPGDTLSGDDVVEQGGVRLYIPRMHSWMLFGMVVDYVTDELGNSKFDFSNPNETGRCGCGESFQVSREPMEKSSTT